MSSSLQRYLDCYRDKMEVSAFIREREELWAAIEDVPPLPERPRWPLIGLLLSLSAGSIAIYAAGQVASLVIQ